MKRQRFPFHDHWTWREASLIEEFRSGLADHLIIAMAQYRKLIPTRTTGEIIAYLQRNARPKSEAA